MDLPPAVEGDEEVQYVFLEFKHPEGDTQLIPGTELVLKDLDTDNPHIELNGLKYAAKYEDTVGSLLVCSSTAEPEAAEEEAAAAAQEDVGAGGAGGEQAQAAAKKPDVSLVVCEKRLVAQLIPIEPGQAAAATQAAGTAAAAAGADAGGAAAAGQGAGAAAAGDAPQQMEVE